MKTLKTLSDQELAETETLLRQRLAQLADHAPATVQVPGEVQVVTLDGRRRSRSGRRPRCTGCCWGGRSC